MGFLLICILDFLHNKHMDTFLQHVYLKGNTLMLLFLFISCMKRQTDIQNIQSLCLRSSPLALSQTVSRLSAAWRAPEGSAPSGLPAAEFGSPGSPSAEAVEPGEDSAGPGVAAPQTGPVTAQPQAALLPQTVEAGLQEGHGVERCVGGMSGRKGNSLPSLLLFCQHL